MALSEFVEITLLEQAVASEIASFDTCAFVAQVPTATMSGRYETFASLTEISAHSPALPTPVVAAATIFFSQSPNPGELIIGRRGTGTAQVSNVAITTADDGTWSFTVNSDAVSYLASVSDTLQSIAEGLVAAGTAGGVFDRHEVTASTPITGAFNITANVAGDAFTISTLTVPGTGVGAITTPTANVAAEDISDALTAIRAAGAIFYGFTIESATEAAIDDASAWAAAQTDPSDPALFFARTSDTGVRDATSGNLADDLYLLGYDTTHIQWTKVPSSYPDVAMMARGLAANLDQDAITLALKGLIGVTPDAGRGVVSPLTSAQVANVRLHANTYTLEGGLGTTYPGKVVSGSYTDTVVSRHWLRARLQEAGFQVLRGSPTKISMDAAGAAALEGAFRGVLAVAESAKHIAANWTVNVPDPATLTSAQRATRHLPNVVVVAQFRGAVHSTAITVYLSY
jgi:hypothetical protein